MTSAELTVPKSATKPASRRDAARKDRDRLRSLGWRPVLRDRVVGSLQGPDGSLLPVIDGRMLVGWKHAKLAHLWPTQDALRLEGERASGNVDAVRLLGEPG